MRAQTLLLSLLVVATVDGQLPGSYLPLCAQPCARIGAASSSCDSTDYTCICKSSIFHTVSTCCVRSSCDTADDNLVWEESRAFCSDFGVSITKVPDSACSITSSYSIPTSFPTAIGTFLSTTATATADPLTITNTISISGGQVTTIIITYTPTATGSAVNTATTGSSSDSSTSNSNGNSSGSGSSISSNGHESSSGLSTGAKIGIGVGAGVGGLAIIGGIIALIVYCCSRRRRETQAAGTTTAYTPVNTVEDNKVNAAVVAALYNEHKPELNAQQQAQQHLHNQQQQQQQQQHNPAAVPASALPPGLAAPVSPVSYNTSSTTGTTSELHSQSQGYYQSPDGWAQELGAISSYQHHYQYHPGVVTQAEMPADQM